MLVQRREILDRLSGEDRTLVARFWDMAERADRHGRSEFSQFMDPGQRTLISNYSHLWPVEVCSFGGFEDAERQIMAVSGSLAAGSSGESLAWPMVAVEVTGNFQFAKVSHRDYLGALLSLGLKRELFGDILVLDGGCQVVLHEHALPFVLANWASVGPVGIEVCQIDLASLLPPARESTERTATVATLRLDAVVAAAYGLSRAKATELIKAGKVKLNHRPEIRPDRLLAEGAMLSLAGLGRAELLAVGGASKSGRVFIRVGRWR